jgi:hypothetical protein
MLGTYLDGILALRSLTLLMSDFTTEIEDRGGLDVMDGIKSTRLELRGGRPLSQLYYM